jgi:hypothetical protein
LKLRKIVACPGLWPKSDESLPFTPRKSRCYDYHKPLKVNESLDNDSVALELIGSFDETAILPQITHQKIILNMEQIKTFNSIGIRQFIQWGEKHKTAAIVLKMSAVLCSKLLERFAFSKTQYGRSFFLCSLLFRGNR